MSKDDVVSARLRFLPKKMGEGRGATWRVYDLQNGSYPYQTPELGKVLQDTTEPEIRAECERLTAKHGYLNAAKKAAAARGKPLSAVAAAHADAADDEVADA